MKKVISYIDGLNLYHAIDDLNRPHLKWVDLWALSLADGETVHNAFFDRSFAP